MATAVYYAESLGTSTTSSTSPQDKVTASVSVVSGRKYLILGSATARIGTGLSARNVAVQLWDDTGGAELALVNSSFVDVNSDPAVSLGAVYVAGSTGTVDFQIRYYRGGATNTTVIESARLLVIELGDDDQYVTPSDYARSSTSYGDAATLTFTPPSSGDYIFLFGGSPDNFRLGVKFLAPDGTSVDEVVDGPSMRSDISSVASWGGAWVQNLAASSQTAKIQFRSTDGVSHTLSDIFIVALRASDLSNVQYSQDNTPAGGTQTSYTNSETLGATGMATASRDTVAIGAFSVKGTSTSVNSLVQITEGGSPLIESTHRPAGVGTRDTQAALVALKSAAAGASITYDINRRSSSGTSTTTVNFAAIVVFEISGAAPSDISGNSPGSSTAAGALGGVGNLSGDAAGLAAATATLVGAGRLSGAAAGSSTAAAVLSGLVGIAGSSDGTSTATGAVDGDGSLSGAVAGVSTATGVLLGDGPLSGATAGSSTAVGVLVGDGDLAGAIAGASDATGHVAGTGDISGDSAGIATVDGHLIADGALDGASAGTSTTSGDASAVVAATGTSAGSSTATGDLDGEGALAGTVPGTSAAAGDLDGVGDLAGAIAGAAAVSGDIGARVDTSGAADGSSTTTGSATATAAAVGQADGAAAVAGELVADGALAGASAGTSTATGDLAEPGGLHGTASGTSTATGALEAERTLGEIIAAWGVRNAWQPRGAGKVLGQLRGAASGSSSATGALSARRARKPAKPAKPAELPRFVLQPARPERTQDRLIPLSGPLHGTAGGTIVRVSARLGAIANAKGAARIGATTGGGELTAIGEIRAETRSWTSVRGEVVGLVGDTLDDEEALAMILAAA